MCTICFHFPNSLQLIFLMFFPLIFVCHLPNYLCQHFIFAFYLCLFKKQDLFYSIHAIYSPSCLCYSTSGSSSSLNCSFNPLPTSFLFLIACSSPFPIHDPFSLLSTVSRGLTLKPSGTAFFITRTQAARRWILRRWKAEPLRHCGKHCRTPKPCWITMTSFAQTEQFINSVYCESRWRKTSTCNSSC